MVIAYSEGTVAWFVVIGSGAFESQKVEAESYVRHRKGVAFYNGAELVAEFPGHQVFRVMECDSAQAAEDAVGRAYSHHRGQPQDVATRLRARARRDRK